MFIICLIFCFILNHILTENNQKAFNTITQMCDHYQYSTENQYEKEKMSLQTQMQREHFKWVYK